MTLRELREARGWSWKDEARELRRHAQRLGIERVARANPDSIVRTIARWESTTYEYRPDERYQLLLAHAFGSDIDRLLLALEAMGWARSDSTPSAPSPMLWTTRPTKRSSRRWPRGLRTALEQPCRTPAGSTRNCCSTSTV